MTNETPCEGPAPYLVQPIAEDPADVRARHESNRDAWNEGAARYVEWVDETVEFIRAGKSNLHPVERANLGSLRPWCHTAIHLQCASGKDTLSLLVEGAERVVGVDISDVMIENARRTSQALGAPATWYRCDLLDTPHDLDGTADLVYTGRGALNWIHDLQGWASVVARLLKPGGIFHVLDNHPLIWLFNDDTDDLVPAGENYFAASVASQGWPAEYIGDVGKPVEEMAVLHERLWTLADIFGALTGAGLVVEKLGEHREGYWQEFAKLKPEVRATIRSRSRCWRASRGEAVSRRLRATEVLGSTACAAPSAFGERSNA